MSTGPGKDGSSWRLTGAVAALALAVRLAIAFWAAPRFPAAGDGFYYDTLAHRLASGRGYTWLWPDGAVTYAAHYPVGYPALLAAAYTLFGGSTAVTLLTNAVIGSLAAPAMHRLALRAASGWRAFGAAMVVALHPALVPYTAAVMTEGVAAALLVVAAAVAAAARNGGRSRALFVVAGVVMGVATLVRPQCLVLAPVLGLLGVAAEASWRRRAGGAALVTAVALACCAPWTARNCMRMHRCALVSVNGGWNLLIGTQTTTGGWGEVVVPSECREVWDEAAKDACFERAARAAIVAAPGTWLAKVPTKLSATFDYIGAAPWYLHLSNPAAFDDRDKRIGGGLETLVTRLLLLGALVACARREGPRHAVRWVLSGGGALAAITPYAWPAYLALVVCLCALGLRLLARAPMLVSFTAAVVAATAATHAVFFGAGRYGLVVLPLVAGLALAGGTTEPGRRASPMPLEASESPMNSASSASSSSPSARRSSARPSAVPERASALY